MKLKLIFAVWVCVLAGCSPVEPCEHGTVKSTIHSWSKWSDAEYWSPHAATNQFLGIPINKEMVQRRRCDWCNLEQHRIVQ